MQAVGFYLFSRREEAPLVAPLESFPYFLGSWATFQENVMDEWTLGVLRPDDYLIRAYRQGSTDAAASLFVAYFRTQRSGHAPHTPKNCLPGNGWTANKSGVISISMPPGDTPFDANRIVVARGDDRSVVLYWYQTPTRVVANEYYAKVQLVLDSVRYNRSDTALVRIVVPIVDEEERAERTALEFARLAHAAVRTHIPIIGPSAGSEAVTRRGRSDESGGPSLASKFENLAIIGRSKPVHPAASR